MSFGEFGGKGEKGGSFGLGTYKLPKTNSPTTAIRFGTAMFMPHSQGIGKTRTMISVAILTEVRV